MNVKLRPPLIINLALTGTVHSKRENHNLPISEKEIIEEALELAKMGASIVHIHARDKNGKPTWRKTVFERIIYGIREKNKSLIINVTTSGRLWNDFKKRSECLEIKGSLKPDMASLTLGSMNFISEESVSSPKIIKALALKMRAAGIKPELEVFEPGMVNTANYLLEKEIVFDKKPFFNIFMGSLGTSPFTAASFSSFYSLLPHGSVWSAAGIGKYQLDANVMGMTLGGHVRIGLEDNLYFDRNKKILASNRMLVERIVEIAQKMQIRIATIAEARKMLGFA